MHTIDLVTALVVGRCLYTYSRMYLDACTQNLSQEIAVPIDKGQSLV